jgi:S-adenosylmethionine hydrolase
MSGSISTNSKIVALLSDFGGRDAYAGIMKGVILALDPAIRIVDLTHEIDPQDILSGAYVLYTAWDHFPRGSVFCAVVDPGVGSGRGTLYGEVAGRHLVAPDNGLISMLMRFHPDSPVFSLRVDSILELLRDRHRGSGSIGENVPSTSNTFHGRDLFAPAAALCALGSADRIRGPVIEPVLLPQVTPEHGPGAVTGRVLHVDRFGNCITSVHTSDIAVLGATPQNGLVVQAADLQFERIRGIYAEAVVGAPLCVIGSSGFLEIAVRQGSARERFGIAPGRQVTVKIRR